MLALDSNQNSARACYSSRLRCSRFVKHRRFKKESGAPQCEDGCAFQDKVFTVEVSNSESCLCAAVARVSRDKRSSAADNVGVELGQIAPATGHEPGQNSAKSQKERLTLSLRVTGQQQNSGGYTGSSVLSTTQAECGDGVRRNTPNLIWYVCLCCVFQGFDQLCLTHCGEIDGILKDASKGQRKSIELAQNVVRQQLAAMKVSKGQKLESKEDDKKSWSKSPNFNLKGYWPVVGDETGRKLTKLLVNKEEEEWNMQKNFNHKGYWPLNGNEHKLKKLGLVPRFLTLFSLSFSVHCPKFAAPSSSCPCYIH